MIVPRLFASHISQKPKPSIGILYSAKPDYGPAEETKALIQTAEEMGCDVHLIRPTDVALHVKNNALSFTYKNQLVTSPKNAPFKVVIPRFVPQGQDHYPALITLHHFEKMGIPTTDRVESIYRMADKFKTHQILATHNVPTMDAHYANTKDTFQKAISPHIPTEVVVTKTLRNRGKQSTSLGQGVNKVHKQEVHSAINGNVMFQPFQQASAGKSLRCFVIGDDVPISCELKAKPGEWRTNVVQGGQSQVVTAPDTVQKMAIKATHALGLKIAGVDILETPKGHRVLEVNATPGFHTDNIEKTVARRLIQYALKLCHQSEPAKAEPLGAKQE